MKRNSTIGAAVLVFLVGLMAIAVVGRGALAQAQVTTSANACLSLQGGLGYGASDNRSGNAVTALQTFLSNQGYFNSAYIGTGRYGFITARAVVQFQTAHGISATGYVGPLTRALIKQLSCGTVAVPPTSTAATLYTINPTSGVVGTTISIAGFGFTNSNTVLMDGLVAARNVPIASSVAFACITNTSCHGGINQTVTFTVPSNLSPNCPVGSLCPLFLREVTPATYKITVQNENGTSNTLYFTVTSTTTNNQQLSIHGLTAPASLSLGQQGTWTVNAVSNGTGNLHYSVVWGDEANYTMNGIIAPQSTSVQSSATFTHTYRYAGTYTPVFTVADDSGYLVSASNTVVVTPLY